ncbi:Photosynthetic reaction center cytochrome C subunit [Halpernia humi]|uniref:Photosynthetic reaction center cytochrome c subunit n=1 Tax=Halpernia humi TaxID=493375 RepID=A0A1H5ZP08_9FLAO|nr:c-type cytochrome [Halpernia humi]SEG37754.1 Photosynthetic reaction center cytochrome C subunit [Halpernia humi]
MKTSKLKAILSSMGFLAIIGIVIIFTTNSTKLYKPVKETQSEWKNLKVLPQNISEDSLHFVMKTFSNSLGVNCAYCHAARADDPQKLDFASDAKKSKLIARGMLEMTDDINSKYFLPHAPDPKPKQVTMVYCITCHRGQKNPTEYLQDVSKMIPKLMPERKRDHR